MSCFVMFFLGLAAVGYLLRKLGGAAASNPEASKAIAKHAIGLLRRR
jgi:hypothetical protein